MSDGLPQGWVEATLRELVGTDGMFTDGDWILSKHLKTGNDVRLIQLADVGVGRFLNKSQKFISSETAKELRVTYLREGDVLISRMADPLARACVFPKIDQPAITAVDVAIVRCDGSVAVPGYVMHLCNSNRVVMQAEGVAVGTTRKRISRRNLEQIRVPLASLVEQRRIVAKLDELLSKVHACQQRLKKILDLQKRFRQAVLAAACSGRLTADWREKTSSDLEWPNARLGDLAELVSGAGFPLEFQGRKGLPYPFFKVGNLGEVESGQSLTSSEHTVDVNLVRALKARLIPAGATAFAKIGMAIALNRRRLIGRRACIDNNMMAAIPSEQIHPQYLHRFLETVDFMPLSQATTVPSLRKGDLEEIEVPLPSLTEQHEIVRRVEGLFALADQIERRYSKAQAQVDKLTQSLLAKAFRGQLVTTEAELARREGRDYEDAQALLERLPVKDDGHKSIVPPLSSG